MAGLTETPPPGTGKPIAYLWSLTEGHRLVLAAAVLCSIAAAGLTIAQPRYLQRVINFSTTGADYTQALTILIVLVVGASVAAAAQGFLSMYGAEAIAHALRRRVTGKYVAMTIGEADERNSADLISRAAVDTVVVKQLIAGGILPLLGSTLTVVGITVVMITIDPLLFGLSALAFLLGAIVVGVVAGVANRTSAEIQARTGDFSVAVERALASLRTVKANNAQAQETEAISVRSENLRGSGVGLAKLASAVQPTLNLCVQGALVAVILVGAFRLANGGVSLGGLLAYVMYMFMLIVPIATLGQAYTQLQIGLGALERCREVDTFPVERMEGEEIETATIKGTPLVELEDVDFAYDEDAPVLRDVTLTIRPGERITVVGGSGSGKSTLLELIERFYAPDEGNVRVRGLPLEQVDLAQHRRGIAFVPQESAVLTGTLADNLRLSRPGASDAELLDALAKVGLRDLATRSKEGLNADLGQAGVSLSSGQRQRIAWARVILSEADLILMDEPDSNLDTTTRGLVGELLDSLARDRTVVVVSHRLDRIRDHDRVVVLHEGRVVADGKHADLLVSSDHYRQLAPARLSAA